MHSDLYCEIKDALKDRGDWETKQQGFYMVRYGGIHRTTKPYANAPDMHYPLCDTVIDKVKPLYIQQLYAQELLTSFVSTKEQSTEATQSACEWFDFQMKNRSNFEKEIFSSIDQMLEAGFITVKAYWHEKKKQICFSCIDNMLTIVPKGTEELQAADWFVHVIRMSKAQFKRKKAYADCPVEECVGDQESSGNGTKEQLEDSREGITHSSDKETVIIWECYTRDSDDKWIIETISPVRGFDKPIRDPFKNPYDHAKLPFARIEMEITKRGWYSSRGVPELLASYQMALKKLWDHQLQYLDFHGVPTYVNKSGSALPNGSNYRGEPGQILPPGIEPMDASGAPPDYDRQMGMTRAVAEDRIQIPDLGASEHLSGRPSASGEGPTATQINAIVGQSGQSNDVRARVFRLALGEIFSMAWALLCQFKKDEINYLINSERKQAPKEALHLDYIILPNGSPDSWNKAQQLQRAIARLQMFKGDPYIRQGELRKTVLELDDTKLIQRLYQDPGDELEDQAEQQAQEISIMVLGRPAKVSDADDDGAHIGEMDHFVQRRIQTKEQITPELARLLLMHGNDHIGGMTKKKDPRLKQITQQSLPLVQYLSQIAAQPDQSGGNIVSMPPQGAPGAGGQPGAAPEAPAPLSDKDKLDSQADAQKIEIAKGQLLVAMSKAGMNVNHLEVNTVLERLGLPPLADQPITTPKPVGAAQ